MASRRGRAAAVRAPNGNSRAAGKAHERPRDKHATDTAKQLQRAQREHRKEGKQGRAQAVGVVRRLTRGERHAERSEEHTSELQSLMRISYAVFCLKKKTTHSIR